MRTTLLVLTGVLLAVLCVQGATMTIAQARTEAQARWGTAGMVRQVSTGTTGWAFEVGRRTEFGGMQVLGSGTSFEKAFESVGAYAVAMPVVTGRISQWPHLKFALDPAGYAAVMERSASAGIFGGMAVNAWVRESVEGRIPQIIEALCDQDRAACAAVKAQFQVEYVP